MNDLNNGIIGKTVTVDDKVTGVVIDKYRGNKEVILHNDTLTRYSNSDPVFQHVPVDFIILQSEKELIHVECSKITKIH